MAAAAASFSLGSARADGPAADPSKPTAPVLDALGFEISPVIEGRVRGELRHEPVNDRVYGDAPLLRNDPIASGGAPLGDQFVLWERARLGLQVKKGILTARVTMQDVRSVGDPQAYSRLAGQPDLPVTAPFEAFAELTTDDGALDFKLGRQEIELGDGRLVGKSDDLATGRSLDAARVVGKIGDFDLQAFAAMLVLPGEPTLADEPDPGLAPGAQLYALDGVYHFQPYLGFELTGLARVVRQPLVDWITPSDTFVGALRVFGDHRGWRYSVVGAFEGGRIAQRGIEETETLLAGAVAGRVSWETSLPWHMTFGAQGAYASGGGGTTDSPDVHTFDPILPDTTMHFGQSGLYALSNVIEAGADFAVRPIDELGMTVGYRFAALADAKGRWVTSTLQPVGASATNTSQMLGHVISFDLVSHPIPEMSVMASYAAMILGDGAKNIFAAAHTDAAGVAAASPDVSHYAMVDVGVAIR
ncbi:MAG TPA: alginate export family protein [Polyangiaceae bacterium]|nr:alginate export family protein [Polyangiaceae bacterium]